MCHDGEAVTSLNKLAFLAVETRVRETTLKKKLHCSKTRSITDAETHLIFNQLKKSEHKAVQISLLQEN